MCTNYFVHFYMFSYQNYLERLGTQVPRFLVNTLDKTGFP